MKSSLPQSIGIAAVTLGTQIGQTGELMETPTPRILTTQELQKLCLDTKNKSGLLLNGTEICEVSIDEEGGTWTSIGKYLSDNNFPVGTSLAALVALGLFFRFRHKKLNDGFKEIPLDFSKRKSKEPSATIGEMVELSFENTRDSSTSGFSTRTGKINDSIVSETFIDGARVLSDFSEIGSSRMSTIQSFYETFKTAMKRKNGTTSSINIFNIKAKIILGDTRHLSKDKEQVRVWGREMDPSNPLYTEIGVTASSRVIDFDPPISIPEIASELYKDIPVAESLIPKEGERDIMDRLVVFLNEKGITGEMPNFVGQEMNYLLSETEEIIGKYEKSIAGYLHNYGGYHGDSTLKNIKKFLSRAFSEEIMEPVMQAIHDIEKAHQSIKGDRKTQISILLEPLRTYIISRSDHLNDQKMIDDILGSVIRIIDNLGSIQDSFDTFIVYIRNQEKTTDIEGSTESVNEVPELGLKNTKEFDHAKLYERALFGKGINEVRQGSRLEIGDNQYRRINNGWQRLDKDDLLAGRDYVEGTFRTNEQVMADWNLYSGKARITLKSVKKESI